MEEYGYRPDPTSLSHCLLNYSSPYHCVADYTRHRHVEGRDAGNAQTRRPPVAASPVFLGVEMVAGGIRASPRSDLLVLLHHDVPQTLSRWRRAAGLAQTRTPDYALPCFSSEGETESGAWKKVNRKSVANIIRRGLPLGSL